ncbi:hypothetical protein TNCV_2305691 [Trichonephila clavipes]|nr:hypothetical protein TNCV_2305691 [Trichonephila clavipes]
MTRKHNHRFPKRPRNVHPKVGFKKDGIRIVWLVIRDSIRPPTQVSKDDSGAMSNTGPTSVVPKPFFYMLLSPSLICFGQTK